MLRETKGVWSVTCDRCHASAVLVASSLEEAREPARAASWMDQARRGKGLAKWPWLCPKCRPAPAPPGAMGRST